MTLRLLPSDPLYPRIAALAQVIAELANPCLFWNLRDMGEAERLADLNWAREQMRQEIEELTR